MHLALYQPDQAGNVGTILRLAACLSTPVDIIEPCGFAFSDRALKRAGMDYAAIANVTRHQNWDKFESGAKGRIVLLTTKGTIRIDECEFQAGDIILLGSESAGVPEKVHQRADMQTRIPQAANTRSLNIAVAAGIALAEALRQTKEWPR
jgi:tRNA (cytidine/uridine-2'-O-)-methyltransferase